MSHNQANGANLDPQLGQKVRIDAAAFGAKFQSKGEVFRFLTHDCGTYLPSYENVTVFHMRDLVAGKKIRIKAADVKHITVPHFEGLKIQTMLSYASTKPFVMACLPAVLREREALPRQYVANCIYTKVGDSFKQWVDEIVNTRHELRRQEDDQIQMDPEIAEIFNSSAAVAGKCSLLFNWAMVEGAEGSDSRFTHFGRNSQFLSYSSTPLSISKSTDFSLIRH